MAIKASKDGGEACDDDDFIDSFMADTAMIEQHPDQWHRHYMACRALAERDREIQAAAKCKPWEE